MKKVQKILKGFTKIINNLHKTAEEEGRNQVEISQSIAGLNLAFDDSVKEGNTATVIANKLSELISDSTEVTKG